MPSVYILFSVSLNKFYIGATSTEVDERIDKHLKEHYGQAFTSSSKDWELHLSINCKTMHQALKIEQHIKKMKSRKYLVDIKTYPEILTRLKEKYPD